MVDLHQSNVDFSPTRWSLIDTLRTGSPTDHIEALDTLSKVYWPAVYSYLRRRGKNRDAASEITQAFFSDVIFQRDLFKQADETKAKLRTLILKALENYMIDQHRRQTSRNEHMRLSNDQCDIEENFLPYYSCHENPGDSFQLRWASAVLQEALIRCENLYLHSNQCHYWEVFRARVVNPNIAGSHLPSSESLAKQYDFDNSAAVNNAVFTVRKRQVAILKEVIAETTSGEGSAEEEYQNILDILS